MRTIDPVYTIEMIREETRILVEKGRVGRHQKLYTLCQFFPTGDWRRIEATLEEYEFLSRDRVIDLIGRESWENDR
jgi:hypothetical protein